VAAMTMRKTASSLKKMRFFKVSSADSCPFYLGTSKR
jgi:hypothetical protein